jgi:hypothetical protein
MMMKKSSILPIFGAFLIFLGCSNSNKNSLNENNKTKLIKTDTIKAKKEQNSTIEESFLNEMGFNFKNQKIIIDLNKTKSFFSKIRNNIEKKVNEIEDINLSRESGVILTKDKLDIDLNSTKNLLNNISGLFKNIISDINKTLK